MTPTPPEDDAQRTHAPTRRLFWLTALVASLLHWIPHFPPQIDLSQHAAQIRLLHDYLLGRDFAFREILSLNLFTPYLPAYLVGALLTGVMPVVVAVKLLWTLGAFGTVYAASRVRTLLGSGDAWDWIMIPGLFGVTFQWGFLTFLFALPFGIGVVELWVRHLHTPQRWRGAMVGLALACLFFAHSLVTAWVMTVCAAMLLTTASTVPDLLRRARRTLPLLTPLPIAILWLARTRGVAQTQSTTTWNWDTRYLTFFPQWFGISDRWVALLLGLTLIGVLIANGARLTKDNVSRAPLLVTILILIAGPNLLYGNAMTYNRFFSLLGPTLGWALATGGTHSYASRMRRSALPIIASTFLLICGVRMVRFAGEQVDFEQILQQMSPGQRVLSVVQERSSAALGYSRAYLHFPVWYQAERGGLVEPSFAAYLPMIMRFRAPGDAAAPYEFESRPDLEAIAQLTRFRYMLVRSATAEPPLLRPHAFTLVAHEGLWWLYQRP